MRHDHLERLYERHIKGLPKEEQLRLLSLVAEKLVSASEVPKRRSLLMLHGLGKEIWKDVDAQAYVRELREEWEEI